MLYSRNVTIEEYEDMMKECFSLVSSYSNIEGCNQVDWKEQMNELMPNGIESPGNYLYTFINEDEQTVGYVWCYDKDDSMRLIAYIGVKDAFRKRGYATQMMKSVCQAAKQDGVKFMVLGVEKKNEPAIHLYKKEGFNIIDEQDIRYAMLKNL